MDNTKQRRKSARRRLSTLPVVQITQVIPGESSTDGDYVVLREIRERHQEEKRKRKRALANITEATVANNFPSMRKEGDPKLVAPGSPQTIPENIVDLKQKLLQEIESDNPEKVKESLEDLKSLNVKGTENYMTTTNKMNILHYAIDKDSDTAAEYLTKYGHRGLLIQEFEVSVKGSMSSRNTLHLLTIKSKLQLIKLFIAQIKEPKLKTHLMTTETAMEIVGQRPRTFSCLHIAAFNGNRDLLDFYLAQGLSVNLLNSKHDTALLWASRWGHAEAIKTLISKGAQANIENDKGSTALYWATRYNHAEAVRLLASEGKADVNQKRKVGLVAPIILAAALGYSEIVAILLNNGADVNMEIRGGETPLMQAAREGHLDVAKTLVNRGAVIDKQDERGDTSLTLSAKFANSDVVDLLIRRGANITHKNHEGFGAWHYAISGEDNDTLVTMVQFWRASEEQATTSDTAAPTKRMRKPPLCIAASFGACDKIQFLISLGLNPNDVDSFGNTPIHHAAISDHHEVIKQFGQLVGINGQNEAGDTPLHLACLHGHSESISVLLENKARANIKNQKGESALHIMARSNNTKPYTVALLMDYMIKAHAWDSLHVQDQAGNSALHEAAAHASCEVLWEFRVLSFKQKNTEGNTPLHLAVRSNEPEVLHTMLEIFESLKRDADINERNNNRETVLQLVALQGFTTTTKELIRYGADLSARDKNGNTVLHLLATATVTNPDNAKRYLEVMDVIIDELVRWWCLREERIYPDDDKHAYRRLKRSAFNHLTAEIMNDKDLSVLTLASKVGAKQVLDKILMMPFVNCVIKDGKARMDITFLTPKTNSQPNRTSKTNQVAPPSVSCMEWLISMDDTNQAGQAFDVPSLRQVEKIYGRICAWTYLILMILHLAYMGAFSGLSVSLLGQLRNSSTPSIVVERAMYIVVPLEPGFILLYMVYLLIRHASLGDFSRRSKLLMGQSRLAALQALLSSYISVIISFIYALIVIAWIILYTYRYPFQDYFLAVSLLFGWLFSISFTRGFKAVHYFWRMLQLMIVRDVFRFIFIYVFILMAFAFAFHALFQVSEDVSLLYPNALDTLFATFNIMIGMDGLFDGGVVEGLESVGRSSVPLKVAHIFYVVLTTIVLLNVLIAMMNDSYQNIRVNQTVTWRVDSVRLGLEIEKILPWSTALFSHIRIQKGDILSPNAVTEGRASSNDFNTNKERWFVEVPLAMIALEKNVLGTDLVQHVTALNARIEQLEYKLTVALQQLQQNVKELKDKDDDGEDM